MNGINFPIPIIGFSAYSGTGKTTLLKKVLPRLRESGLRVTVVKHAHHSFDPDHPGKDSYELRKAGADCCVVISRHRVAIMEDFHDARQEPTLADALSMVDSQRFDLVVIEGFKHEPFPKIELCRPSLGLQQLFTEDDSVIAVATDAPLNTPCTLPILDLNDPAQITAFVLEQTRTGSVTLEGRNAS